MLEEAVILIVDDEALARQRLKRLLNELSVGRVIEAANGEEAIHAFEKETPQIIMLDVRMPGLDGIDVAEVIKQMNPDAQVIFTTAFDEYALSAFEVEASGYLLKPVSRPRLKKALLRALSSLPDKAQDMPKLRCHEKGAERFISVDTISALVAEDKYVTVYHEDGKALTNTSLKQLEEAYPSAFCRVHRGSLVNLNKVQGIKRSGSKSLVLLTGTQYTVEASRRLLPQLKEALQES